MGLAPQVLQRWVQESAGRPLCSALSLRGAECGLTGPLPYLSPSSPKVTLQGQSGGGILAPFPAGTLSQTEGQSLWLPVTSGGRSITPRACPGWVPVSPFFKLLYGSGQQMRQPAPPPSLQRLPCRGR